MKDAILVPGANIFALQSQSVSIVRMTSEHSQINETEPVPQSDAHNIILQLKPFEDHRLWRSGKLVHQGGHPSGALAITDLSEEWRCHHRSSFDNIRFRFPRQTLSEFSNDAGFSKFARLTEHAGPPDPVVQALAMALLPSLSNPAEADVLFIDHVLFALQAHLVRHYGGVQSVARHRGGLTKRQLDLATDLLAEANSRNVSIADIARECGLSNSYFIRAFKKSTGQTPHRWLSERRSEKAEQMLLGPASIADIAIACGFSDQSHFTRSFTAQHGISPGSWRRQSRV